LFFVYVNNKPLIDKVTGQQQGQGQPVNVTQQLEKQIYESLFREPGDKSYEQLMKEKQERDQRMLEWREERDQKRAERQFNNITGGLLKSNVSYSSSLYD
jgi:hypothetical protein